MLTHPSHRLRRALAITLIAAAAPAVARAAARECFVPQQWSNWTAAPDSKSIYLRVDANKVFRVDLASACTGLRAPSARLVTTARGSTRICSAEDLDLQVATPESFPTSCFVRDITRLSREQAAALPKSLKP